MLNRKRCLGLLTTIATVSGLLLSAQVMAAEQWVKVLTNSEGVWYVDKGSISPQGKNIAFWAYVVHDAPTRIGKLTIRSEGDYVVTDCRSHQYQLIYKRLMDENNQLVREIEGSNHSFGSAKKGSGEGASINFVCKQ
jgi:hypothetical protein